MLAAVALLVGVIAVGLPATAQATEGQDYRGFTTATPFSHFRVTEWTGQDVAQTDGEVAFCFNQRLAPPTSADSNYPVRMTSSYDLLEAANKPSSGTRSAFDNNEEFTEAILRTIYNGYGFNAAGIKERFGLSEGDFYHATQLAVWRYTDNMFTANGSREASAESIAAVDPHAANNFNVARAAAALLGKDSEVKLAKHPEDAVIRVYVTDQTPQMSGSVAARGFQNLLTVEMTHGKGGERVVVEGNTPQAPKKENRGPSSMRTTVSVEGKKASSETPVELEANEVSQAVHVVDTIAFEGFEKDKEYTFTGELMDLNDDRVVATATQVETVKDAKGTVKVDFGERNLEPGHSYVVFEKAVRSEGGQPVEGGHEVVHRDREDRAQTIVVKSAPVELPGESTPAAPVPAQPNCSDKPNCGKPKKPNCSDKPDCGKKDKPKKPSCGDKPDCHKPKKPEKPEKPKKPEKPEKPKKPSCEDKPDCGKKDKPKKDKPKKEEPKKDAPAEEPKREKPERETPATETSESETPATTAPESSTPTPSAAEKPVRSQGNAPQTSPAPTKAANKEEKRTGLADTGASVITMSIFALVMIFLGGTLILVRLRSRD
ncbi:hypothetical protein CCICO_01155 [Corynebacterium ciconiae DSM 44920]|nr:hypothetical protein CCICO_01155 [Corynebacterium ciconiae DSM 44920]